MKWKVKGIGLGDRKARAEAAKKGRVPSGRGAPVAPQRIPAFINGNELVMETLKKRLRKLKLKVLDRPLDKKGNPLSPQLPPDLTALNDEQLGRLYGHFCLMVQYVQLQLAVQSVKRALADRAEKYERARTWLLASGTVGDKEAQVEVDTQVQEASLEAITEGTSETLKDALMQSYLIGKDACSREITRRQATTRRELE